MSHCRSCGACCACYRVAFHWSEAEPFLGGPVPIELTMRIDPHRLAMRGTDTGSALHCVALQGVIGQSVHCSIYELRPTPCRELQPDWLDGNPSDQCRRARARHGLPPLEPPDWEDPQGPRHVPTPRSA